MDETYIVKKVTLTSTDDLLYIVQGEFPDFSVVGWTQSFIGELGVFVGIKYIDISFVTQSSGMMFEAYMAKWGFQYPPHGIHQAMLRDIDEVLGANTPNLTVYWGDGSNDVYEPPFDGVTVTHTYVEPGEYHITAGMNMPSVSANDLEVTGHYLFTAVE